ncbi:dihydroxyacetone kinase subunit L [Acidisphaera sp. L21]|uniref:dihydroxyacetone kinase subunit L n=1 Tax=Acidisphaera sp. L21 TaxID=1641851 RepID=UPI00131B6FCA|nr:dihydroxyacetone kinase subunit L [Acidisphaera sp. L21]
MPLDAAVLKHGIAAVLAELDIKHATLTELDGKIGDGDLGITLLKAFRELDRLKDSLPEDVGQALLQCASAVARVSSSSFGTLFATALIAVSKLTKGKDSVPWTEMPAFLDAAVQAMSARGKASLGDKTVLDVLDAMARAAADEDTPQTLLAAAAAAVDRTLDAYRDKPNKIGRARIFAERSVGLDDPGMVAVKVMLHGLGRA